MALCFAHAAAGYLVYEALRPAGAHRPGLLAAAVVVANAPDLDFVPGLVLGQPAAYHRGVTHTVAAVVVVAAIAALVVRWRGGGPGRAWRVAGWTAALWTSHLVLDYFTSNVVPPSGARFLWPFSDRYWIAARPVLPEIVIDPAGRGQFFTSIFNRATVAVWLDELWVLAAVVLVVHVLRAIAARPLWRGMREEA
jgi:membrane-bound metal-dependent hydrolase YbcI (DUF457 family)